MESTAHEQPSMKRRGSLSVRPQLSCPNHNSLSKHKTELRVKILHINTTVSRSSTIKKRRSACNTRRKVEAREWIGTSLLVRYSCITQYASAPSAPWVGRDVSLDREGGEQPILRRVSQLLPATCDGVVERAANAEYEYDECCE